MESKLEPKFTRCPCGQKLRLKITAVMLGQTLPVRCPTCGEVRKINFPRAICEGLPSPAPIPEPRYPFDEKGIEYFLKMFGDKNNPYFGKRSNH